jgi:hypothetical protein
MNIVRCIPLGEEAGERISSLCPSVWQLILIGISILGVVDFCCELAEPRYLL